MLPKLIAFALTSGLAKKAWDRYRAARPQPPEDITEYVARPAAATPAARRKAAQRRAAQRREGPSA